MKEKRLIILKWINDTLILAFQIFFSVWFHRNHNQHTNTWSIFWAFPLHLFSSIMQKNQPQTYY